MQKCRKMWHCRQSRSRSRSRDEEKHYTGAYDKLDQACALDENPDESDNEIRDLERQIKKLKKKTEDENLENRRNWI